MAFYLLLVLLILGGFLVFRDDRRASVFAFLLLTLVSALRAPSVGVDTAQFTTAFHEIAARDIAAFLPRYEIGFVLLCKGLSFVTDNAQWLIALSSAFVNASFCRFVLRHSKDLKMSTALYIFANIFFMNMNVMRQAIATAILLFGFSALLSRSRGCYAKFFLSLLFAATFHTVALAAAVLPLAALLVRRPWGSALLFTAFLFGFLFLDDAFLLFNRLMGNRYDNYIGSEFLSGNAAGSLLLFLLPLAALFFLFAIGRLGERQSLSETPPRAPVTTAACLLFLGCSLLVMEMNIVERAANVFLPFLLLFIPEAAERLRLKGDRFYAPARLFVILLYFASFTVIALFRPAWYGAIPYRLFF